MAGPGGSGKSSTAARIAQERNWVHLSEDTYWDQITRARDRNVGWRIDYYMISEELRKYVKSAPIHMNVMGSDHCPIELNLSL